MEWTIHRYGQVDSTMAVAARLAAAGAPAGTVVVAEEQTAGRGRLGRTWHAPAGTSLLFTVLLRPPLEVARMPDLSRQVAERVGYGVTEVSSVQPAIKDPNDLLVCDRKVAGILCQTSLRGDLLEYLLVGIGLNVNMREDQLPLPTATSLSIASGKQQDREALLAAILRHLGELPWPVDAPAPRARVVD